MKKVKFGIQLVILMLAFPVYFLIEMNRADQDIKKKQPEKQELIDVKKAEAREALKKNIPVSETTMMPGYKLVIVNI